MKDLITLLLFVALFATTATGQSVPQGMQYQAVARDLNGNILNDQPVSLRITLKSKSDRAETPYSEVHEVKTNSVGLFTLVIGDGRVETGSIKEVPWSTSDVWMEIQIKEEQSGQFVTISSSKMLSVPYAFHAATAAEIIDAEDQRGSDPVPGTTLKNWRTKGNDNIQKDNYLGTNNTADLVIVTNAKSRIEISGQEAAMRVTADFNVVAQYPTLLTGTLEVDQQADFNAAVNVNNESPTNLTGTLNVDKRADFNDSVSVNNASPTNLTGTLNVDRRADFNDSVNVNNMSPTLLTGTLRVDQATEMYDSLTVLNDSPVLFSGTLNVKGATALDNTLDVESATTLDSTLNVGGLTVLMDTTQSTTKDNGSLVVEGGVGIEKNLNLGGAATIGGPLTINNAFNVSHSDTGYVATFQNSDTGNGDGIKIQLGKKATKNNQPAKDADVALQLFVDDGLTNVKYENLKKFLDDDDATVPDLATLFVPELDAEQTAKELVAVGQTLCDLNEQVREYVVTTIINGELITKTNEVFGGVALAPFDIGVGIARWINGGCPDGSGFADPLFVDATICSDDYSTGIFTPEFKIPGLPNISVSPVACEVLDLLADGSTFFGANVTGLNLVDSVGGNVLNKENHFITFTDNTDWQMGAIKSQSLEDWAIGYLNAVYLYKLYSAFSGLDKVKTYAQVRVEAKEIANAYLKIGVEYSSGNGDYAEWLERADVNEAISAGDIVGVTGGLITKDLTNAEQVMAVSYAPIVLGNVPEQEEAHLGNNVAFMGQIPVKVMGPVTSGDYIIGKGGIDGYGVAVHPEDMTIEDFRMSVGRSWDTNVDNGAKMVNTIVGVHNGNFINVLKQYEQKFEETESRMASIEKQLEMLSAALPAPIADSKK